MCARLLQISLLEQAANELVALESRAKVAEAKAEAAAESVAVMAAASAGCRAAARIGRIGGTAGRSPAVQVCAVCAVCWQLLSRHLGVAKWLQLLA